MIKKELELAKIKASEFEQKQTLSLAKVQSAPTSGSNINPHQKDSLDLTKQLRVAVEKLKSATNEKEKAEAVKKISEIANYLDDYNIGRVQPITELVSDQLLSRARISWSMASQSFSTESTATISIDLQVARLPAMTCVRIC